MLTQITYDDLKAEVKPGGEVEVLGGGVINGIDLSDWRASWLALRDSGGLLEDLLPRSLKRSRVGRDIPQFVDCDFSGLRCPKFDPGMVRFVRCTFSSVDVKLIMGSASAHFESCRFSGRWEGNFDARPLSRDTARRAVIRGNDFTGCENFFLQGGVGLCDNVLDPDLHLAIWRSMPAWPEIKEIAQRDDYLGALTDSIDGHGPLDLGQDWVVVQRSTLGEALWRQLQVLIRSHPE